MFRTSRSSANGEPPPSTSSGQALLRLPGRATHRWGAYKSFIRRTDKDQGAAVRLSCFPFVGRVD